MKTTLTFDIDSTERKALAKAIGEYFKEKPQYTMPGFRYVIAGKAEVQKDSSVDLDASVTDTDKAFLIDYLGNCGFQAHEETEKDEEPEDEEEPMSLSLSLPDDLADDAYGRLFTLIETKQELFKHAFNSDGITVKREDGKITFDGFPAIDSDHHKAFADFVTLLTEHAKNTTRVNMIEREVTNEKYSFRGFLLRLGMVGPEYKTTRKILLENLSGSAAFKTEEQAKEHAAKWAAKRKEQATDTKQEANENADAE